GARTLTSALIYANPGATEITVNGSKAVYTVYDKDISFENGYGVAFNDEIGITYGEIYYAPFNVSADPVQVKIAPDSVLFDSEHTDNDNYYIDDVTTDFVKGGRIINERVTDVTLNADPTLRDDTHMPIAYTHGDSINLNRGSVSVTFDSGKVLNDLTFSEVKTATDGMVTVVYNDGGTDVEIENGDKLIRAKNNGVPLKLKVTENMGVTEPETAALSVSKAVMRVVPTASERYYGDENPSFAYKYYIGDTEYTATASEDFIQGVVPPMAYSNAGIKAPVGEYDILLQGGSSTNYEYVLEKGTLTVIKRPFDVLEILSGIPPLTSQIIYENPGQYHLLSGSATCTSGQLSLGNFSAGDDVRITYDALYSSVDDSQPADVSIVNVLLDESYGEGGNYVLRGTPYVSGGGNIYGKQILYVTTVRQPKLDYTYGDKLDISEKGVSIAYDDGSTVPNIAYSDLAAYGVKLTFTDNDGTVTDLSDPAAAEDIELDVNTHDGAYFTLEATSSNKVSKVSTKPIIVSKKPLNVNIGSFRSVYGENHTAFYTYAYNTDDFVNGDYDTDESKTEEGVISTEPTFVCLDRGGRAVSSETDVGTYTITMTGGESDNYRFIYNNGILTVSRRPLVITNILKTKIPELSSRTIFEIEGTEHRLPASAEDGYLEFDDNDYGVSLLTGDKVRINFTAVYYSNDKSSSCPVGIEYNGMDTSYEQSNNYEIDTVNSVKRIEDGGVIHDREIE
ncbi:MAG: hypothetical protein IJP94_05900, partial [Clostridia bacterium]|nr:hypothetical protein [Clostridia bacterium]